MAEPEDAADLYGLPLADFTTARNALAAKLGKEGDRAASDEVKRLAKPSITAWALNQVARRQPELVAALLDAGQQLAQAQQALLAGRGQAQFREAARRQKNALARVVEAAAGQLSEPGRTPGKPVQDRLEATARAAAAHPEAAELLRGGRLTTDLDPAGFGELAGFAARAAPIPFPAQHAPTPAPKPGPAAAREELTSPTQRTPSQAAEPGGALARLSHAREEVTRLQRDLQALRQQAGEAEGDAARARQAASKADLAWVEARKAVAQAEKLAGDARRVEEDAAQALAAVRSRLDQGADALERAESELRELRRAKSS